MCDAQFHADNSPNAIPTGIRYSLSHEGMMENDGEMQKYTQLGLIN